SVSLHYDLKTSVSIIRCATTGFGALGLGLSRSRKNLPGLSVATGFEAAVDPTYRLRISASSETSGVRLPVIEFSVVTAPLIRPRSRRAPRYSDIQFWYTALSRFAGSGAR